MPNMKEYVQRLKLSAQLAKEEAAKLRQKAEAREEAAHNMEEAADRIEQTACKLCGRYVPMPCNTLDAIYESGPWDFACEDLKRKGKD